MRSGLVRVVVATGLFVAGIAHILFPLSAGGAETDSTMAKGQAVAAAASRDSRDLAAVSGVPNIRSNNTSSESARPDRGAMVRRIDELIERKWRTSGITPAPPADDAEFLRRATLDLTGVIPRVSSVRAFLEDRRPDKRERLIDELVESPRYATHMATTWRNRLLPSESETPRMGQILGVQNWLREQFAENRSYNSLVGDLLVATNGDELGPALYFQAQNLAPEKLAASTAELFLGMRLHCAQCHDHPYDRWKQQDFWGYAAFFARVREPENSSGMMRYRLLDADGGEVRLPDSDEIVPPRYLNGRPADENEGGSRRLQLAIWMASRDNPYVARAAVNWAWSHLFGRGLVDPVGDFGDHNPPSHPDLLDELSAYFVQTDYDLRALWRALARTRAYQLSSDPSADPAPAHLFAHMNIKALTPEQLYDSVMRAAAPVGSASNRSGGQDRTSLEVAGVMDPRRVEFVRRMRSPSRNPTEFSGGIQQALLVMNGQLITRVTSPASSRLLGALGVEFFDDAERVETLFFATLSRPPNDEERAVYLDYLKSSGSQSDPTQRNEALGDILWALLNSSEFAFNH